MLFLYFEDWSQFLPMLDHRGISHGNQIVKVYTAPVDPRERLGEPNLKVVVENDIHLFGEEYFYKDRGTFSGMSIESQISKLPAFSCQ